MLEIDGSRHSGSGTIVRFATALAALTGQSLHLVNIRAKRDKPGLRYQHLAAVKACAALCGGDAEGLAVGAREITFIPGRHIRGGDYSWEIGTAGSTTMLALGLLPVACRADTTLNARIEGGVFQDFAPSPLHMQHVLAPLLGRMGAAIELRVIRPGYVPKGGGVIELRVRPAKQPLAPLSLLEAGEIRSVHGISIASHLAERQVSARMAQVCVETLAAAGIGAEIERVEDTSAAHAGACLAVWTHTSSGCIFGGDRAGALRRSSESIGRFVARSLLDDLGTGAAVDRHIADQLVVFATIAAGTTRYVVPAITDHVQSNLWLAEQFGARTRCRDRQIEIEGIGVVSGTAL
jgi:RNA 3'-terminal phosphate cyclase (ATP)